MNKAGAWLPFALALVSSAVFCFVVFPRISESHNAVLDPDGYGRLGLGLWKHGALSYYPDTDPTVARGPAYPALLWATLAGTGGWWPYGAQLAQCALFALTALLLFHMANEAWGRRAAVVVATIYAVYPLPIWYTSRIWLETLAAFLLTAAAALALELKRQARPRATLALLAGLVLGIGILCKATFLPVAIVLPLILLQGRWSDRSAVARVLIVPLAAAVVVAPWTLRNARLTGRFIPVQALMGSALLDGDYIAMHFADASFSYMEPCARASDEAARVAGEVPPGLRGAAFNAEYESRLARSRLLYYRNHPLFLVRKTALNALFFWTLGEAPRKSLVLSVLLVPLVLVFLGAVVRLGSVRRFPSAAGIPAIIALFYYLSHLPLNALARYAVPVVPLMLAVTPGLFSRPPKGAHP